MIQDASTWSRYVKDLTGLTFGRLKVLSRVENRGDGAAWLCECECGAKKEIRSRGLLRGSTTSCGCYHRERAGDVHRTHGLSKTPEQQAWNHAKERCYNPKTHNYAKYGGRGIVMCDEWKGSFESFYRDMGPRPSPKHSLDRFPNRDGNYEPGNCRWATPKEQAINRDYSILITYNGKTMPLTDWARELGQPYKNLHKRIRAKKWSIEKAFTTPTKK
jgi:hypothetical protein